LKGEQQKPNFLNDLALIYRLLKVGLFYFFKSPFILIQSKRQKPNFFERVGFNLSIAKSWAFFTRKFGFNFKIGK
jgi:hypothetical protein